MVGAWLIGLIKDVLKPGENLQNPVFLYNMDQQHNKVLG